MLDLPVQQGLLDHPRARPGQQERPRPQRVHRRARPAVRSPRRQRPPDLAGPAAHRLLHRQARRDDAHRSPARHRRRLHPRRAGRNVEGRRPAPAQGPLDARGAAQAHRNGSRLACASCSRRAVRRPPRHARWRWAATARQSPRSASIAFTCERVRNLAAARRRHPPTWRHPEPASATAERRCAHRAGAGDGAATRAQEHACARLCLEARLASGLSATAFGVDGAVHGGRPHGRDGVGPAVAHRRARDRRLYRVRRRAQAHLARDHQELGARPPARRRPHRRRHCPDGARLHQPRRRHAAGTAAAVQAPHADALGLFRQAHLVAAGVASPAHGPPRRLDGPPARHGRQPRQRAHPEPVQGAQHGPHPRLPQRRPERLLRVRSSPSWLSPRPSLS